VKARLASLESAQRINAGRSDSPVLRRRTSSGNSGPDEDGPVLRKP